MSSAQVGGFLSTVLPGKSLYFIHNGVCMSISISQFLSPPFRVLVPLVLIFVLCFGIFVLFSFVEGCVRVCMCVCVCVCVCVVGWLSVSSLSCSRFIAACVKDQVFSFNRNGVGGLGACGEEAPGSLDCFWSCSQLLGLSCFHLHPARVNDYPPPSCSPYVWPQLS